MRSNELVRGQAKRLGAKVLRPTALAMAIGVFMASTALAQSSEGAIYGVGKAGTAVTVTSIETGQTRQVQTDSTGNFSLAKMAPGRYKISAGGVTQEVTVSMGSNTTVDLNASQQLQAVTITGARQRAAIDVKSVESNTVFTQEQIQELPLGRNPNAVAILAPGVIRGDSDMGSGNLPSFGGASVAENGYYINGFDVTNIRNFLAYAELPFDAIAEQQIKTGGYGAEYGRSLGGVISLATKRGTNEWKGGVAGYWTPSALRSQGHNVLNKEPESAGNYFIFSEADKSGGFSSNIYAGGPLVKDKLFMFGLIEMPKYTFNNFSKDQSIRTTSSAPNGILKLDFTPNDTHRLELTAINNKSKVKIEDYQNASLYSITNDGVASISEETAGGSVLIAKYTGYLTDNLTVSGLLGKVHDQRPLVTGARTAGLDCPVVYTSTPTFPTYAGCWTEPWPSVGGRDAAAPPTDDDNRRAFRFDIDYKIGKHTIRAGVDNQTFSSYEAGGSSYTGGKYWAYFNVGASGNVNGVSLPVGTPYVRERIYNTTSGAYEVINTAKYIEDSWQVNKNLMLYGGLRWESFDNKNGDGESFVKANNLLAPRVGASWNVNGDSSLKVFGNAGRYFIPVASNTNIRATRGEIFTHTFFTYTGMDPVTAAPLGLTQIGEVSDPYGLDGSLPNPATIADMNLSPMSQDEFIFGFQRAVSKGLTVGAKLTKRKLNNGMDDYCDHKAIADWVKANINAAFVDNLAPCMMVNPGRDVTLQIDTQNDGNLVKTTIPASVTGLSPFTRNYNALELSFNRAFDGKWGLAGSYTLSGSKGTGEGYVNSTINQDDAGVSQDFDFGAFDDGADGYLPNDRRHQIKLFGTVGITDNWRLGVNFSAQSGRPKSRIGFAPCTAASSTACGYYGYSSASTFYYLNEAGETVLGKRGNAGRTPWTNQIDLQAAYTKKLSGNQKLTLQVDVFNIFNNSKPLEYYEINDYSRATTIVGLTGRLNANYGNPTSWQTPRYFRFTGRYEF